MLYNGATPINAAYIGNNFINEIRLGSSNILFSETFNVMKPYISNYWRDVNYSNDTTYEITEVGAENEYNLTWNPNSYITITPDKNYLPAAYNLTWDSVSGASEYIVNLEDLSDGGSYSFNVDTNSADIVNLIPNNVYYVSVIANEQVIYSRHLHPIGYRRMIQIPAQRTNSQGQIVSSTIYNVRDIGGLQAGEKKIKYGLVYRGGAIDKTYAFLNDKGRYVARNQLGIKAELDFRSANEIEATDMFGDGVKYNNISLPAYSTNGTDIIIALRQLIDNLDNDKPTYCHCSAGADRTGSFMWLLEGLLGVSESDMSKEYELTAFYCNRNRTSSIEFTANLKNLATALRTTYSSGSINDIITQWWLDNGLTSSEISNIKDILLI